MSNLNYLKNLFGIGKKKSNQPILINILTRTSGRPNGFNKCRKSIENQTYIQIKHLVSYDDNNDLHYLKKYDCEKIKVKPPLFISKRGL